MATEADGGYGGAEGGRVKTREVIADAEVDWQHELMANDWRRAFEISYG